MWDTGSVGAIINFIIEVEEEKRDEYGEISEDDRVSVAKGHLEFPYRRGLITLCSKKNQSIVYTEKAISW